MFKCEKCKHLEREIDYLRSQVKTLTDRLVALAAPHVYEMIEPKKTNSTYYGDGRDLYKAYDQFGQEILVEQDLRLD